MTLHAWLRKLEPPSARRARDHRLAARRTNAHRLLAVAAFLVLLPAVSRAVIIDYADLVDRSRIIRTGQTLAEALPLLSSSRSLRGAAQPLVDPHTALLNEALDMMEPPPNGAPSFMPLAAWYPAGQAEPAWVALVRGGRIAAFTDGAGRVRLFVPGANSSAAWRQWYPVIRHILTSLVPDSGLLEARVWSYTHDYSRSRITFATKPHSVRGRSFPPPGGRASLDGSALAAFFSSNRAIAGARRTADGGLELIPGPGSPPRLNGRPATLADLAVAWRAVAWAGDNDAFISLDPHADPTRATVNFGGYLENTSMGATVLEADKRFKTLTSGLDPNTHADLRADAARTIPGFLTTPERDLLRERNDGSGWIGTRFWFYPESVELVTDADFGEAEIIKARFTADAERQRGDFADPRSFARDRRRLLSPSIRAGIDDLNARYEVYAAAFEEFRELETVARLLGICSWLKRGGASSGSPRPNGAVNLDLDALLGMTLPAVPTPPDREQMIAANWLVVPSGAPWPDTAGVQAGLWSTSLSPLLDESIETFFETETALAGFLAAANSSSHEAGRTPPAARARASWQDERQAPVRRLIKTPADLQAWATRAAEKRPPPALTRRQEAIRAIDSDAVRLGAMERRLRELEALVGRGGAAAEDHRAEGSRLAAEYQALGTDLNNRIREYNGTGVVLRHVLSIAGGINLGPDEFRIRVRPGPRRTARTAPSPRPLTSARPPSATPGRSSSAPTAATPSAGSTGVSAPRSSTPTAPAPSPVPVAPPRTIHPVGITRSQGPPTVPTSTTEPQPGAAAGGTVTGAAQALRSWDDQARTPDGRLRVRRFDATQQTLLIREVVGSDARFTAARREGNRIVFRRIR